MKKYLLGSVVLLIALISLVSINKETHIDNFEHIIDSGKLPELTSVNEVVDESALIVKVQKISEEQIAYPLENDIKDNFTKSKVEVLKVIKQMDNVKIEKGDMIEILECEWIDYEAKLIHHLEGYSKMKNNKKYTLFLGYNAEVNNFYPIGVIYVKIPLDEKDSVFFSSDKKQIDKLIEELRNHK